MIENRYFTFTRISIKIESAEKYLSQGGTPYHPDSFTQKFQRFLVRNDLPHIRLHDLRHASATLMIEHGVDIKTVQARLGHSDISTTLNIYSHSTEKMNRTAADKLDAVLL